MLTVAPLIVILAAALTSIPAEASIAVPADDFISMDLADRDSLPPAEISISAPADTDTLLALVSRMIRFLPDLSLIRICSAPPLSSSLITWPLAEVSVMLSSPWCRRTAEHARCGI